MMIVKITIFPQSVMIISFLDGDQLALALLASAVNDYHRYDDNLLYREQLDITGIFMEYQKSCIICTNTFYTKTESKFVHVLCHSEYVADIGR